MLNKVIISIFILVISSYSFGQHNDWWQSDAANMTFIEKQMQPDKYFHSGMRPYKVRDLDTGRLNYGKLWKSNLTELQLGNYQEDTLGEKVVQWKLYPLADMSVGGSLGSSNQALYHAGLGLGFRSNLGKQWSVDLNYLYAYRNYSMYDRIYENEFGIHPGMQFENNFGNNSGAHYMKGAITWSPSSYFALQVGYGNHHWGEGKRSLFLSDQSMPMPYAEIETTFWRMKYSVLYTYMQDKFNLPLGVSHRNKHMTMHYLSWNIIDNVNLSLFEAVVWQGEDTLTNRGYDISYLNPIIFFRPVEYAQGSADNVLLGVSLSYKINENNQLYYQWLLDEFLLAEVKARNGWWANKSGIQAGYKTNNLFGVKGLFAQLEYNWVRPFTYTHGDSWQNYGQWNMPMAHPFGANFMEFLGVVNYQKDRFFISNTFSVVTKGLNNPDSAFNSGGNIFESYKNRDGDYGHHTFQGIRTNYWQNHTQVSYLLFPAIQMRLEAGFKFFRIENKYVKQNDFQIFLGLRTSIWNIRDRFR